MRRIGVLRAFSRTKSAFWCSPASTSGLRYLPSLNPHNGKPTSLHGSSSMADLSPLRGVQACVFDAYGTLFDFAAAAKKVLGDDTSFITLWRDKQLQYTWLRAAQGRHADFLQVTGDALDFALETIRSKKSDVRDQLMSLFVTLDPFPEVPNVLRKLKTAGMRTAILSNGSPAMLDGAVKAARLEPLLDAVLSVEEVGVYKPHPKTRRSLLKAIPSHEARRSTVLKRCFILQLSFILNPIITA